jgi:hypothetical protein
MRRLPVGLAVLSFIAVALPSVACAAPEVTFEARFVPVMGYRDTGNLLGGGAILDATFKISGTEYGGFPPPLIGLTLYFPPAMKTRATLFRTCPKQLVLDSGKRKKCPAASEGARVGRVKGIVTFHGQRVPEEATLQSFVAPGLGLSFLAIGHSPVSFKTLWGAEYGDVGGGEGFGGDLIAHLPLLRTSPGTAEVSVEEIDLAIGAVRLVRRHRKPRRRRPRYYLIVPNRCPRGGFPFKAELTFAGVGDIPQQTMTAGDIAPCPRR